MKDIFTYKSLRLSYERVLKSSTGDVRNSFGESLYKIKLKENLEDLSKRLQEGKYTPSRPFKYYEPKQIGTQRVKTVLSIEDSIVYQAISNHIAEKVYDELEKTSKNVFGNILHENVKKGVTLLDEFNPDYKFFKNYVPLFNEFVNSVNKQIEGENLKFKLDTDITGFFDSIPHSSLAFILQERKVDNSIIELLLICLNMWSGTRNSPTFQVGIPQGPIASFFVANLLLHNLDTKMIRENFSYYRYTDDMKIYANDKTELEGALVIIDSFLKDHSLSINSKKTLIEIVSEDKEKERKKSLKNQSLKEIVLTEDEKALIENEYFEEYENHKEYFELNVEPDEALKIIKRRIDEIENDIYHRFYEYIKNGYFEIDNVESFEDDLLDAAYIWRAYVRLLFEYDKEISLNKKLVPIWIAGLNTLYWRANHFCWNLNKYKLGNNYRSIISKIKTAYKRFEWVEYQTNILFINNLNIYQEDCKKIVDRIKIEDSPLIRLSLYKILLTHLKEADELWSMTRDLIKNDKEPYIRYTLSDWILYFKRGDLSVSLIKSWFSV
ncbi:MAG: hypothetical protein H6559_19875 [Lewinellaceae bacterium]|nr:hypothetical protein [Lewinellaceae bacterium]